jgi:hypothetical protein
MMRTTKSTFQTQNCFRMADGEASASERSRMEAHLTACWQCRSRRTTLDRSISNYMEVHDRPVGCRPSMSRAHNCWYNSAERAAARPAPSPVPANGFPHRLALPAPGPLSFSRPWHRVVFQSSRECDAAPIPDGRLTPGPRRRATKEDLCSSTPQGFYPIPSNLASERFREYRIQKPRPWSYEVDYLITPGRRRRRHPQSLAAALRGRRMEILMSKMLSEDHLHDLVCEDRLDLAIAQRDIATNWIESLSEVLQDRAPAVRSHRFRSRSRLGKLMNVPVK